MNSHTSSLTHFLRRRASIATAAVLLALGSVASADTVQFNDGWFGATWTSTKILDTTSGSSATFSSVTNFFDGGPVPCRETTHNFDAGVIVVAHVNSAATYDPASGAICAIDGAYDLIHYTDPNGAVRYRLLLVQNGTYYHHTAGTDVYPNLWASYVVSGLTATAFSKVVGPGPESPDFSCTGGLITWGFSSANSAGSGPNTKVSSIDNWSVTLNIARQSFYDGDFSGGWNSTKILDTTPGSSATWSTTTQPSAGFPNAYRELSHTFANGAIAVAHFDAVNSHDPSVMPVYEVSGSYTLRHFTPALGAVRFYLAIQQGGNVFVGPWDDIYVDAWATFWQNGLLATDFTNYLGGSPLHPDFSATGAVFQLGFVSSNSVSGGPITKYAGIDNWTVRLELSPRCSNVTGSSYCYGDGSGPSCPCFPSVAASAVGHGCPNSLFASGALLIAQGTASLSNDTLQLQASAMPNSSCLYFQGSAPTSSVAFDGLRCAGGNVIRLGTKQNICNASQYPDPSDQSISVRGQLFGSGTRYYQTWYRNPAAFCTSAVANFTNGIQIHWTL